MIEAIGFGVEIYAILVTIIGATLGLRKWRENWVLHDLTKVWGFKNGDPILVVCSELDDGEKRQLVDESEFLYLLKYGDIDALFEIVATLLRLFPRSDVQVMSAREAALVQLDYNKNLVVVGGPDYNQLAAHLIDRGESRICYKAAWLGEAPSQPGVDISIVDRRTEAEYGESSRNKDFGCIERIPNPYNSRFDILMFGGCHTIGVTCAAKSLGLFSKGSSEVSDSVLVNAKTIRAKSRRHFLAFVRAERIGSTLVIPKILEKDVWSDEGRGSGNS